MSTSRPLLLVIPHETIRVLNQPKSPPPAAPKEDYHNEIERRRKERIRKSIQQLSETLKPPCHCGKETNAEILQRVVNQIRSLQEDNKKLKDEIAQLPQQGSESELQSQLGKLILEHIQLQAQILEHTEKRREKEEEEKKKKDCTSREDLEPRRRNATEKISEDTNNARSSNPGKEHQPWPVTSLLSCGEEGGASRQSQSTQEGGASRQSQSTQVSEIRTSRTLPGSSLRDACLLQSHTPQRETQGSTARIACQLQSWPCASYNQPHTTATVARVSCQQQAEQSAQPANRSFHTRMLSSYQRSFPLTTVNPVPLHHGAPPNSQPQHPIVQPWVGGSSSTHLRHVNQSRYHSQRHFSRPAICQQNQGYSPRGSVIVRHQPYPQHTRSHNPFTSPNSASSAVASLPQSVACSLHLSSHGSTGYNAPMYTNYRYPSTSATVHSYPVQSDAHCLAHPSSTHHPPPYQDAHSGASHNSTPPQRHYHHTALTHPPPTQAQNAVWRPYSENNRTSGFCLADILSLPPSDENSNGLHLDPPPHAQPTNGSRIPSFLVDHLLDDI